MARIVDTVPAFEAYARAAFSESPVRREFMWRERYEAEHPEVFEAFHAGQGEHRPPLVRELTALRKRVQEAAPVMRELIEELDPAVQRLLGVAPDPSPVHVLMVDGSSVSALVGSLGGDVALFHCLEWFQSAEGARVLVAHEATHAWHRLSLEGAPEDDLAWMVFSEGLAMRASRALVPGRPDDDYFWYGYAGFEDWLPWCRENHDLVLDRLRSAIDDPAATDSFFGAGLIEGTAWRVGFFLADELVGAMAPDVAELARWSVEEGQAAVRSALGVNGRAR